MKRGLKKVLLNEKLADWSAAYLSMWKALESFDPKADRWSEPVSFGNREDRIKAAETAISRVARCETDQEKQGDVDQFREHIKRLLSGTPYGPEEARFTQHVRRLGSMLADQSVVVAGLAGAEP